MKIPFDIKYRPQIESGEYKVETRDGKQVRIVSWDKNGFECKEIVALVANVTGTESCNIYTINGLLRSNSCQKNMNLFIVTPEEELTDFEQEVSDIVEYCKKNGENVVKSYAKRHAKSLLSIASEQFIKDGYIIEKWDAMKEALRLEYERGKADALKDIPRWKRFTPNTNDPLSEQQIYKELENSVLRVDAGGYWWVINREELNKLPKDWVDFSKCV